MMTKLARRAPGLYWVKFRPGEEWTIARFDLTASSGQPGWELIGLPIPIRERGDEETRAVPRPVLGEERAASSPATFQKVSG
jgi:hypothetical protein